MMPKEAVAEAGFHIGMRGAVAPIAIGHLQSSRLPYSQEEKSTNVTQVHAVSILQSST